MTIKNPYAVSVMLKGVIYAPNEEMPEPPKFAEGKEPPLLVESVKPTGITVTTGEKAEVSPSEKTAKKPAK